MRNMIADFLLVARPLPPPITFSKMELRRRLERLDDLLSNPTRRHDRAEMRREDKHSMPRIARIVRRERKVLESPTRASLMFLSARTWLDVEDRMGLVPRPVVLTAAR